MSTQNTHSKTPVGLVGSGDLFGACIVCGTNLILSTGWVPSYNDPDNSGLAPMEEPFCPKCEADAQLEEDQRAEHQDEPRARRENQMSIESSTMSTHPAACPQSSARRDWLARHDVRIQHEPLGTHGTCFWLAWLPDNDDWRHALHGMPVCWERCGHGATQDEALAALAKMYGIELWEETSL